MIHAIRIKDGRLYYCNRLTQTPRVVEELKDNQALYIRIGEFSNVWGIMKVPLLSFMQLVGYIGGDYDCLDLIRNGTANTGIVHH